MSKTIALLLALVLTAASASAGSLDDYLHDSEVAQTQWSPRRPSQHDVQARTARRSPARIMSSSQPPMVSEELPPGAIYDDPMISGEGPMPYESYGPEPVDFGPYENAPYPQAGPAPGCSGCGHCCSCPPPPWVHRTGIFGEFLYLKPRGANVAYAQPRDGLDPQLSTPMGATAVVAPSYRAGYRVGGAWALDDCTSLVATFTSFSSSADNQASSDIPITLHSLVTHPATVSAASNSLVAQAQYGTEFRLADLDYRALLKGGPRWAFNYRVGARYAHLEQTFFAQQPISPGTTNVNTNVNFDGGGPRVGFDVERFGRANAFFVYSKGFANFLAGTVTADYTQTNTFALTQAQTSWKDNRIVSILEFEAGLGWMSPAERVRLSAGYYVAAWYNAMTTPNWIAAVQSTNFGNASDTITFDGLVVRGEFRW